MESIWIKSWTSFRLHYLKDSLKNAGFIFSKKPEDADVVILYGSGGHAEEIEEYASTQSKPILLAGCAASVLLNTEYAKVGPDQLSMAHEMINEVASGNMLSLLVEEPGSWKPELELLGEHKLFSRLPLKRGCPGKCSYCDSRFKEDDENQAYYTSKELLELLSNAPAIVKTNIKNKTELALISSLITKENQKILIESIDPSLLTPELKNLAELLKKENIYTFLSLTTDAIGTYVLEDLKKKYTKDDLDHTLSFLRREIPSLSIHFKIGVGAKGEDEAAFNETITFIKHHNLDSAKGFIVEKEKQENHKKISEDHLKNKINKIKQASSWTTFQRNRFWFHWKGSVLIVEKGPGYYCARNESFREVIIPFEGLSKEYNVGDQLIVRISKTGNELVGKVLDE
jgi:threonylcarbamoyladenosine tRNA methylthiotransferase CDKAL1